MEATLKFNLPEEDDDFNMAVRASGMHSALWDYKQFMRDELKHNDKLTDQEAKILEKCQSKFFEILKDNGIYFD